MTANTDGETQAPPALRHPRRLRRIVGPAVTVVVGGVVLLLAALVVPGLLGYQHLTVLSGSMAPTIPTGSLVLVKPVAAGDVAYGDVVLVHRDDDQPGGLPYLHRVVGVEQIEGQVVVQTKGDANRAPDPDRYVLTGSVPVTALHVPRLGFLVAAVSSRPGWITFIVLPGSVLCAAMLFSLWWPKAEEPPATARRATVT